jgi:hypothetical protein
MNRIIFAVLVTPILYLQGCASYQQPVELHAVIARQSQYEEVKQLAKWKSIYYRPAAKRYGCNLGDTPPPVNNQYTIYFDDAMPWVFRITVPHVRGCVAAYQQIKETKERIGGVGYWGLSGITWEDRSHDRAGYFVVKGSWRLAIV